MPGVAVPQIGHLTPPQLVPKTRHDNAAKSIQSLAKSLEAGFTNATHFPTVAECSVHLQLLEAIYVLRSKVLELAHVKKQNPLAAWNLFLKLAVARFSIWVNEIQVREKTEGLPSLDILMVWHAFMLNPGPYSKFERLVLKQKLEGKGIDWKALYNTIDSSSSNFQPTKQDEHTLEAIELHPNLLTFLASDAGAAFVKQLRQSSIPDSLGSKENLLFASYNALKGSNDIYQPPNTSFSFDLASAVDRQLKFTSKMVSFNWLRSPYASSTLTHATERYSKFFALMAANPQQMLAPTLEVDLAWHTHQLSPAGYRKYCLENAGRFINHNDMITEAEASNSFATAGNVYKGKFGAEYSFCLCWHCEAGLHSGLEANERKDLVSKCVDDEVARRRNKGLNLGMSLGNANCDSCGLHPHARCTRKYLCAGKHSDCGGCNGESGNDGCGGCGNSGSDRAGDRAESFSACDGGCGSCNGECGNGGCGGCSGFESKKVRGSGSDCNGGCGSCNGECGNGGCGGCSGQKYDD